MAEVFNSIAARLRDYIGNNRCAPRRPAQIPVRVSPLEANPHAPETAPPSVAFGFTRDISHDGLALVMPAIHVGGQYLAGANRALRIFIELPTREIELTAHSVRHERLDREAPEIGYVIGAHITDVNDEDRRRFMAYLNTLK